MSNHPTTVHFGIKGMPLVRTRTFPSERSARKFALQWRMSDQLGAYWALVR